MQFDVVTLFPEMFRALTDWGITSRAAKQERLRVAHVESARFHHRQLPDHRRSPIRRRPRHGDAGAAARRCDRRGESGAGGAGHRRRRAS